MAKHDASPLSECDHSNLDALLRHTLNDYRKGALTESQAVSGLAHVITALANGNVDEARQWFERGRMFMRQTAGH